MRQYSLIDRLCLTVDQALRALSDTSHTTGAANPAKDIEETKLTEQQRKHSAGLMRVNHAGEICAQALYHGQGLVSKDPQIQEKMRSAAIEEGDHLNWCKTRLNELSSHTSYLKPLWYAGSFCIGMTAGMVGDKWSLGFLAETEHQVIKHLAKHREALPVEDLKSLSILKKMEADETKHKDEAIHLGAKELPWVVKCGMNLVSKIMVRTAYWI